MQQAREGDQSPEVQVNVTRVEAWRADYAKLVSENQDQKVKIEVLEQELEKVRKECDELIALLLEQQEETDHNPDLQLIFQSGSRRSIRTGNVWKYDT